VQIAPGQGLSHAKSHEGRRSSGEKLEFHCRFPLLPAEEAPPASRVTLRSAGEITRQTQIRKKTEC
ncbi:MAG: hypothetical protein LW837_14920, partial [Roseomonas sp.]|nr:hypothetical protein [Roseomonas sp.]